MFIYSILQITVNNARNSYGLGLALLPCSLGDEAEELECVPVEYTEPGQDVWVLSHVDLRATARVRIFLDRMIQFLNNEIDLTGRTETEK